MARQLPPEEAQVFCETIEASFPADTAEFLQNLLDKQGEPLELTFTPSAWFKGTPPDTIS